MIFVTGTDTDCGKTTVGRSILVALRARGLSVAPLKPIETGCLERDGHRVGADAEALALAAGVELLHDAICPIRLDLPASPERAAEAEGVGPLDLSPIKEAFDRLSKTYEFVLVEGAGGLLVPVTPGQMMADLPKLLGLPVLVVARDALGTVNHTLLTLEAIRTRGIDLLGVVFSATASGEESLENIEAITHHGQVRSFGRLPRLSGEEDLEALARCAENHLDLDGLLAAVKSQGL